MNFGYEDHVTLLTELKVDPSVAAGPLDIKADTTWLVCADVCIPQDGNFTLPLKIDPAAPQQNTAAGAAITAAREQLPNAAPWPVKVTRSGDQLSFTAGPGLAGTFKDAAFYPYDDGLIVNAAAQPSQFAGKSVTRESHRGE